MTYIPSPVLQHKTKGGDLLLEMLRCSQIGLPNESVYIHVYAIHRIRVNAHESKQGVAEAPPLYKMSKFTKCIQPTQ